ncbi:hypothetical protein L0657_09840 [Dyadobacter sp. CY345]|uniref:hypothetical protein n=1 Tax=Dyadobacter sp. CY345 TaxID=2909335 RepID=UPI001F3F61A3|nr:hypothetical protein [Dyadobacter sp. CY345]MCF2444257.1 hypothetical protein [Dyadobacter sp. CY345]
MKVVFRLYLLLSSISLFGQNYITPKGEFMDTTRVYSPGCAPPYQIFYYQVKAKYPVSSALLLAESRNFIKSKERINSGSGYVTFRFIIDCEGIMSRVLVQQTDENYKPFHFEKEFVNDLYSYLKTMRLWKTHLRVENLNNINYVAFVSFKIKNGEIINIIP